VLDSMTLQQYMDMYKNLLTESSMQAILKLTEVAEDKQKKKAKGKKEKKQKKELTQEVVGDSLNKKEKKMLKKKAPTGAVA
jgi:hypothetical protein